MCTKDGKKLNGNLMYTIRPIGEAINYNLKKQIERNTLMERQANIAEEVEKLSVGAVLVSLEMSINYHF